MKILSLDLTYIPNREFSVARCSEAYDDFIADNEVIPDKIYVKMYQFPILTGSGNRALGTDKGTWRGIPLVIK